MAARTSLILSFWLAVTNLSILLCYNMIWGCTTLILLLNHDFFKDHVALIRYNNLAWGKGHQAVPNFHWVFQPLTTTPSAASPSLQSATFLMWPLNPTLRVESSTTSGRCSFLLRSTSISHVWAACRRFFLAWLWTTGLWPSFKKVMVLSNGPALAGCFFLPPSSWDGSLELDRFLLSSLFP